MNKKIVLFILSMVVIGCSQVRVVYFNIDNSRIEIENKLLILVKNICQNVRFRYASKPYDDIRGIYVCTGGYFKAVELSKRNNGYEIAFFHLDASKKIPKTYCENIDFLKNELKKYDFNVDIRAHKLDLESPRLCRRKSWRNQKS